MPRGGQPLAKRVALPNLKNRIVRRKIVMDNWILNCNQNDIVINTKIQLSRNIEKTKAPEGL